MCIACKVGDHWACFGVRNRCACEVCILPASQPIHGDQLTRNLARPFEKWKRSVVRDTVLANQIQQARARLKR